MYFKAYLQTQCLFVWHHGKIKRNQPRPQKKKSGTKSGSSLTEISKHLKVPRSSVQTIVRMYKHHVTTQPSYRSGWRRVLWCENCKLIPEQQQRTVWRCWRKQVQKYLYPQSYIDITWKAAQFGRSHCSKTAIKKSQTTVCNCTWGQRSYFFGEISSGLMNQK